MGISVLVVDANVENGKHIKNSLEANNIFQVTLATRAIEALMRFTETRFQVAIIDFGLPDLNGVDLIRQIRGIDESAIIVALLKDSKTKPPEIKKLPVNLILDKPAHLSYLPQKLVQMLNLPSQLSSLPKDNASTLQIETPPVQDGTIKEVAQREHVQPLPTQESSIHSDIAQAENVMEGTDLQEVPPTEVREQPSDQEVSLQVEGDLAEALVEEHIHKEAAKASEESHESTPEKISQEEDQPEELLVEEDLTGISSPEKISSVSEIQDEAMDVPPWLKEPAQVEEYLASLGKEHTAYATLLSLGNTPWTYSEQLSEGQAHGIVRLLSEHDEGLQDKGALIRYIRLSSSGNDYLLYATPVIGDINLTLIFSMDTPFSVARRQTHKLSRLLATQDPRKLHPAEVKSVVDKPVRADEEDDEPLLPSDWIPTPSPPIEQAQPSIPPASAPIEDAPEIKQEVEAGITSTSEVPSFPNDWLPKEPRPSSHFPFLDQEVHETSQRKEMEPLNLTQHEPKYYLPFTAILLPRFPNHRLTGSLSNQIETWLGDLCVAWGWRVEKIDLRPEYLRFTFDIAPDVAPAQAVEHLAQNLSSRILEAFPGFSKDLPSGQFWTKSYLLTAGSDVGKDRLTYFIETTRKDQGLIN